MTLKHVVTVVDGAPHAVAVLHDGEMYQALAGYHPNFTLILERVGQGNLDESVIDLFDVERTVRNTFQRLTDRVTVRNGEVFVDGDTREGAVARQILRFVEEGHTEQLEATVKFLEKLEANPNQHSREQLGDWLDKHAFTITSEGDIVGYKGVRVDENGNFTSISSGPAVVDGEEVNGYVPNPVGAIVEISRSAVVHDPRQGCGSGLHFGTYEYAKDFARGAVLEVHASPTDIVSVPTDCDWQKVRTCRYKVVSVVDSKYTAPVLKQDDDQNENVTVAVENAGVWDTRQNHTRQQRYPKGHPKAGQFVPKGATV